MISVIRLKDGTEMVGEVTEVNESSIFVCDPLQINYKISIMQPAPSMGLSRFMPFSESTKFEFKKGDLVTVQFARESLAMYYKHALDTYITDLDERIDEELTKSAAPDTVSDLYEQLLEKFEPSGKVQ